MTGPFVTTHAEASPVPPVGPAPVGEPGGYPEIDAALARLDAAGDRPAAEQLAAYEAAHQVLSQTLASIDQS